MTVNFLPVPPSAEADETAGGRDDVRNVIEWRRHTLIRLGWEPYVAGELCQYDVDLHLLERLVEQGASRLLAWRIASE